MGFSFSHKYKESLTMSQLIFNKGAKAIRWGKDCLFNQQLWDNRIFTCKNINLDSSHAVLKKVTQNGSYTQI